MLRVAAFLAAFALFVASRGVADEYPSRNIQIYSGFGAGSVSDVSLRIFAEKLNAELGTSVIVHNMPQAAGTNAALAVLQAPPDGHAIALLSSATPIRMNLFKEKLPFDAEKDFVPLTLFAEFANVFVVARDSPYKSLRGFIDAARARPGKLNIGTSSVGAANYLASALLRQSARIDVALVPHKTPGELTASLYRGDVEMIVQPFGALKGALQSGSMRALATAGAKRAGYLSDVPTVSEAGVSGFSLVSWSGLYVRRGTSDALRLRLGSLSRKILHDEDLRRRFLAIGLEPTPSTAGELDALMRNEIARYGELIKAAGIEKR